MNPDIRTVLCVDDDPDDRDMVSLTINDLDTSLKVITAADGMEALTYLSLAKKEDKLPCLVILDINMPRMNGRQTLAAIRMDQQLSKMPVVVFSTSNNPEDQQWCEDFGVELVKKPSTMFHMQDQFKRLLSHCS